MILSKFVMKRKYVFAVIIFVAVLGFALVSKREQPAQQVLLAKKLPQHVGLIADGNGRWAQNKGLSRIEGHIEGAKRVEEVVRYAFNRGISYITIYAFSSENWKRPEAEVNALMGLFQKFVDNYMDECVQKGIRFVPIGRIEKFSPKLLQALRGAMERTKDGKKGTLFVALNYTAQTETIDAINHYIQENGAKPIENWETFSRYLYTGNAPDPDLIIRTSGELRLSNFLLLQSANSELYFTDTFWPDFTPEAFEKALLTYEGRERRFGAVRPM